MIAMDLSPEKKAVLSAEVIELLGLNPRGIRLLTAIHEAGHAVVADTVGLRVRRMRVTSREGIGLGGDHTDLETPDGTEAPLPEHLVILAAGFEASYNWLCGRRFADQAKANAALNILGGGDEEELAGLRKRWDRPDVEMQDGILPAALILGCRWSTVVRIGYDLARHGTLLPFDVLRHFRDEPDGYRSAARGAFERWRSEFDPAGQYGGAR